MINVYIVARYHETSYYIIKHRVDIAKSIYKAIGLSRFFNIRTNQWEQNVTNEYLMLKTDREAIQRLKSKTNMVRTTNLQIRECFSYHNGNRMYVDR